MRMFRCPRFRVNQMSTGQCMLNQGQRGQFQPIGSIPCCGEVAPWTKLRVNFGASSGPPGRNSPLPRPSRSRPSQTQISKSPSSVLRISAPAKPLSSFPLQFSTLGLELLQHNNQPRNTQSTHDRTHIWRTSIISLSFQYQFLLSALFSLSALHLGVLHFKSSNPDHTIGQSYICPGITLSLSSDHIAYFISGSQMEMMGD